LAGVGGYGSVPTLREGGSRGKPAVSPVLLGGSSVSIGETRSELALDGTTSARKVSPAAKGLTLNLWL
jgi:hypothetical protein